MLLPFIIGLLIVQFFSRFVLFSEVFIFLQRSVFLQKEEKIDRRTNVWAKEWLEG
jgi:hypothetical protein